MPHLHPPWWAQAPSRAGQEVPGGRAPEDAGGTGRPGTTRPQVPGRLRTTCFIVLPWWGGWALGVRGRGGGGGWRSVSRARREWSPWLESLQEPPFPHPLQRAPTLFWVISQPPQPLHLPSASSHLPSPWPAWLLLKAPHPPLSDFYLLNPPCPRLSYFRFTWLPQWTLGSLTPAPPHLLPLRAQAQ